MSATVTHSYAVVSVSLEAPWRWLGQGWRDIWRRPVYSLGYGAVLTFIGLALAGACWMLGISALIPVLAGAFMLVGPILAVGLYEMSRRYEAGEAFGFKDILFVRTASRTQLFYLGFGLMFLILVWMRIATLLFALFVSDSYPDLTDFAAFALTTSSGLALIIIGTAIGGAIAFLVFAVSAISVPMLMDREIDFVTAIMASINAVKRNPGPMLLWAWLIALLVGFGLATLFAGLIIVFPLVGHATWHAYEELAPRGGPSG
ncbi:MAG TPA: DUF2189 domain-containing protein [Alphaproteobacteria bacterium]|nr:DUF2189 domain-containing protein [Alphaproteobacteria bacterium]